MEQKTRLSYKKNKKKHAHTLFSVSFRLFFFFFFQTTVLRLCGWDSFNLEKNISTGAYA